MIRVVTAAISTGASVVAGAGCVRVVARWRSSLGVRRRLGVPSANGESSVLVGAPRVIGPPLWFEAQVGSLAATHGDVITLWRCWLGGFAGLTVGGLLAAGPLGVAFVAAISVLLTIAAGRLGRARHDRRLESQLPGFLDTIGASLRAGTSLRQAVLETVPGLTGPLHGDLELVCRVVHAGAGLADELDAWADRCPLSGVRIAVAVLVLGLRDGGRQADAVEGVASTLRDRLAVNGELRALSSQARSSALVIVVAPVAFASVAAVADPSVLHFLFASPGGAICLIAGGLLDGVGALWMSRVVRGVAPTVGGRRRQQLLGADEGVRER